MWHFSSWSPFESCSRLFFNHRALITIASLRKSFDLKADMIYLNLFSPKVSTIHFIFRSPSFRLNHGHRFNFVLKKVYQVPFPFEYLLNENYFFDLDVFDQKIWYFNLKFKTHFSLIWRDFLAQTTIFVCFFMVMINFLNAILSEVRHWVSLFENLV